MTALRPGPTTAAVVPDERGRTRRLSGPVLLAGGLALAGWAFGTTAVVTLVRMALLGAGVLLAITGLGRVARALRGRPVDVVLWLGVAWLVLILGSAALAPWLGPVAGLEFEGRRRTAVLRRLLTGTMITEVVDVHPQHHHAQREDEQTEPEIGRGQDGPGPQTLQRYGQRNRARREHADVAARADQHMHVSPQGLNVKLNLARAPAHRLGVLDAARAPGPPS